MQQGSFAKVDRKADFFRIWGKVAVKYQFLERSDEELLAAAALPTDGIALAARTTGYDTDGDEVVELAIASLDGTVRFHQLTKPQNVQEWAACDASGGIAPVDVAEAPELYQFEDEIIGLVDGVDVVVGAHLPFLASIIESSWVSLPKFDGIDLVAQFLASHSTADYPGQPATAATLAGIAAYYGIDADDSSAASTAQAVAACYRALVREHAERRDAKGPDYWARREERLAQEAARNESASATARIREKRMNQMNALLWVAGAIIFVSLAIQFYQRGMDVSLVVIAVAVAVFNFWRAVANWRR